MAKSLYEQTLEAINNKEARVCIIGLGYVGLPLAIECLNAGFKVDGYDVSKKKVELLKSGKSDVLDVPSAEVKKYIDSGDFRVSTDTQIIKDGLILPICVPTPLSKSHEPDVSYIESALADIIPKMQEGSMVVLESTTYPGTTQELIRERLEEHGFKDGENVFIAYSPERVDPGNPKYQTHNTPKVVGSDFDTSRKIAEVFYKSVLESVVPVSSSMSAEMVKLLENTFRSVNIALVNELAQMCELLEIDVWEVIDAASSKPFGFMPFYPGPGVGGHCIPIDPQYLSWKMKSHKYFSRFIELASDVNANMPRYVVIQLMEFLNRNGIALTGSKVLMVGIAYKRDISDVRESPALDIMELLEQKGVDISYHDPFVDAIRWTGDSLKRNTPLDDKNIADYDCILIATDHTDIDYKMIFEKAKYIFDTRNVFAKHIPHEELAKTDKIKIVGWGNDKID
ncbi:MAG: nucleotide sugar dehydrogenase [Candidatus Zixiibacteriota bacterium]